MCGRDVLGKPGSGDRAIAQLKSLSGHRVVFNTAVHIVLSDSGTNEGHLDVTTVHFRRLSDEEIRRYVARDKPYDSAGGFKVEALGISLFDKVDSHDPTALVGLPLIWLAAALRKHGFTRALGLRRVQPARSFRARLQIRRQRRSDAERLARRGGT